MASTTHRVVSLPKLDSYTCQDDQKAIALAQKFRELRLYALKTAPGAFAASYEEESRRGLGQTFERLTNSKATQFVVLESDNTDDDVDLEARDASPEMLIGSEWLGCIVILGPQDTEAAQLSAKADPFSQMTIAHSEKASADCPERTAQSPSSPHYHLNGVFVHPKARGTGQGKSLIEAALSRAERESQMLGHGFVCTIIVDKCNKAARKLYERSGFVVAAEETYVQRPRGVQLVEGEGVTAERVALRMELRRDTT